MTPVKRVTQKDVARMALSLPEATASEHQGTPDYRVRKKIFATTPTKDPDTANIKSTPANLDALVQRDPEVFRDVWAGRWVGVDLTKVNRDEVHALLVDAWRLTAPKKLVREFDATQDR